MKKIAAVVVLALLGAVAFASTVLMSTVGVLFAANAATNPCVNPIGAVPVLGGPTRIPVAGGPFSVTSEYGMRVHPITREYVLHGGTDLVVTPSNGPVVAAQAGVVRALPVTSGGGRTVEIDHGAGLVTIYKHLESRSVQVGETVWAGKQIGTQGTTGASTGPHLHFEVHQSGIPTDPRPWLLANGVPLPAIGGVAFAPPVVTEDPGDLPSINPEPSPVTPPGDPGPTNPVTGELPAQVGPYQGDQILNAAYIIKAGQAMNLDAHTITIGVMTAMGESSLVNIDHGDAAGPDSRGLFQQRANGAWGSYEDRMNPTTASTNFFKALIKVPGYLELEPTIAAHRTQRNADPYHYRPFWGQAVQMVSVLTADPGLLERLPSPGGPVQGCDSLPDLPPAGDGTGAAIVAAATHYVGTPYSWGGGDITGPTTGIYTSPALDGTNTVGFDCSGLVLFAVHHATGIQLPRTAEDQGHDPRGTTVPRDFSQMQPGDVIAFSENGTGAPGSFGHIGIYIGNGQMVHAPRPGKTVEIVQLQGSSYYEPMLWSIKRFTG